jgi:TetR/AcrR family transcriptional regulator, regulator of cefoperazone and chloramphenicol sensitivity
VLAQAIEIMRGTTDLAREAGEGHDPEEKLRIYVRVFLERVVGKGHDSWIHQLMSQEMADPTPVLDLVIDQVLRPRIEYLTGIVADILGARRDEIRVIRCVHSLQSQIHGLMRNPVARRIAPEFFTDPAAMSAWADHIANFSLAGIRALR